jgi:hypothetical protein
MSEQKDAVFIILGKTVTLISDECSFGRNTVADIEGVLHYMGDEYNTLSTAIFAYQEVNDRLLTGQEIRQVMIDNGLIQLGEYNASQEKYEEITDQDIIETQEIPAQEIVQEGHQKAN